MASCVPTPQDDDPYADRRIYPRVALALPAFVQANGERHSAQILDLSSGGAKINCAVSLTVGATVLLDCGTLGCSAEVRWQNDGLIGLCFESLLDVRQVSALVARSNSLAERMQSKA